MKRQKPWFVRATMNLTSGAALEACGSQYVMSTSGFERSGYDFSMNLAQPREAMRVSSEVEVHSHSAL